MWVWDREIAEARRRVREQVRRVRAARQDGGDVFLAERVLRYLWRSYGAMITGRRVWADRHPSDHAHADWR